MKIGRARIWAAALVVAIALGMGGCAAKPDAAAPSETEEKGAEAVAHSLTQEEAKARMDSGETIVILDVRTREEYDAGHIAGAVLLPNEDIGTEMPEVLPDKNAEILIYCRSGNRSAQAAKKLAAMGYTAVYDFGGINTWAYGVVTE